MSRKTHPVDADASPAERAARRQVGQLRRFYQHLAVYVLVAGLLSAISLSSPSAHHWLHWPLAAWGAVLGLRALALFGFSRWLGADWEQRKMRELLADKG